MNRARYWTTAACVWLLAGVGTVTAQDRRDAHGDPLPPHALTRIGTVRLQPGLIVTALCFSPNGTYLASGSVNDHCRLWDAATGKLVGVLGHEPAVLATPLAFSPRGDLVAVLHAGPGEGELE